MKMQKASIKNSKKGFTLIETLLGITIASILIVSVYCALSGAMNNINESKKRTGAMALANEKMEIIRNIPYEEIGTINGIPSGTIQQTETITKNSYTYLVSIEIDYVDDPFDGKFDDPEPENDLVPNDYKKANINVAWDNGGKSLSISSIFVPEGVENDTGGGTLIVNVTDSSSGVISDANVRVVSLDNASVDMTRKTDSFGNVTIFGVESQNYRIFVSKESYEETRTYPNPPTGGFVPVNSDFFVVENFINVKTFFIDRTADLKFKAIDIADNATIDAILFEIYGGKKLDVDGEKMSEDLSGSTNSSGEISFGGIDAGEYLIENFDSLGNDVYKNVTGDSSKTFNLSPDENKEIIFLFAKKAENALIVSVKDENGEIISGAMVEIVGDDFSQAVQTEINGVAYFPSSDSEVLPSGEYSLSISMDGYASYGGEATINNLTEVNIVLNKL